MISKQNLRQIARARLAEAEILYDSRRYDAAAYLCGYAIELALKARLCRTLKWTHFPEKDSEFQSYRSFKVHNLEVLLKLSGIYGPITTHYLTEWSSVNSWNPEMRYNVIGTASQIGTKIMIDAAKILVREICKR